MVHIVPGSQAKFGADHTHHRNEGPEECNEMYGRHLNLRPIFDELWASSIQFGCRLCPLTKSAKTLLRRIVWQSQV